LPLRLAQGVLDGCATDAGQRRDVVDHEGAATMSLVFGRDHGEHCLIR